MDFDPTKVEIRLFGCCSFEDTWHPGIKEWGSTDEESRSGGYVSVADYDRLLDAYLKLKWAATGEATQILQGAIQE